MHRDRAAACPEDRPSAVFAKRAARYPVGGAIEQIVGQFVPRRFDCDLIGDAAGDSFEMIRYGILAVILTHRDDGAGRRRAVAQNKRLP